MDRIEQFKRIGPVSELRHLEVCEGGVRSHPRRHLSVASAKTHRIQRTSQRSMPRTGSSSHLALHRPTVSYVQVSQAFQQAEAESEAPAFLHKADPLAPGILLDCRHLDVKVYIDV